MPRLSTPKPQVGPNVAGFVFGENSTDNSPNKIAALSELKTYMVSYNDGAGKRQTRIVFRVPNSDSVFLLQEKIHGSFVATGGTDWFNKAFSAKLRELSVEKVEGEGPEGAAQV